MSLVEWASTGSEVTQRLNIKNPTEIRMNFCGIFFLHKKLKSTRPSLSSKPPNIPHSHNHPQSESSSDHLKSHPDKKHNS